MNIFSVSNKLDGQNVESDLGPNCLQRLSADDKSRHKQIDELFVLQHYILINNFQSYLDILLSSWVEPALCRRKS